MQNKWKSSPRKLTYSCPVYTQSLQVSRAMTCGAYFGAADQRPELSEARSDARRRKKAKQFFESLQL